MQVSHKKIRVGIKSFEYIFRPFTYVKEVIDSIVRIYRFTVNM